MLVLASAGWHAGVVGLVAARLTEFAGSSDFFNAAFITYTEEQKHALLHVPWEMLRQHTAVSEPVARHMAEAARAQTG